MNKLLSPGRLNIGEYRRLFNVKTSVPPPPNGVGSGVGVKVGDGTGVDVSVGEIVGVKVGVGELVAAMAVGVSGKLVGWV